MLDNLSQEDFQKLIRNYAETISSLNKQIRAAGRAVTANYKSNLRYGKALRDEWLHEYSILPSAVNIHNQIAASREWSVIGRKVPAARAVFRMNSASFKDANGIVHKGWEAFFSRLVNDWTVVGRSMFYSYPMENGQWSPPEYVDVTQCWPVIKGDKVLWNYKDPHTTRYREIPQEFIFFTDNKRFGATGMIFGSVQDAIPYANLDWFLREHDTMQLDGRKIRDIILVKNGMADSLRTAILQSMAIAAGEDPSKHGIPIAELEDLSGDKPISDYFTFIGIANIPRDFKREDFEARYAREIAAALGLAIGQFWYDPRGTNRALEQVQQERSTLKGPAHCVRSHSRTINQSEINGRTPAQKAIMTMEEETDNSSLKLKAEALKLYSEALEKVKAILGVDPNSGTEYFRPEQWLTFFQQTGLMPPNATLADIVVLEEVTLKRNEEPHGNSNPETSNHLDKGMVRMNMDGIVTEYRPDFMIGVPKKYASSQPANN